MDDLQRVQSWFDEGRLIRPLRGPNTVHLARAIASVAGAPAAIDGHVRDIAARIGPTEHLILVLADGFGMNLIDYLPEGSLLRTKCGTSIDAVFPSSTAPALTSIATAQWPATHGLLFWWQYIREADRSVYTLPFRDRFTYQPLDELGIRSDQLFSYPPQVVTFPRDVLFLQPSRSADSVYTRYCSAGTPVHGYQSLDTAIDLISRCVTEATQPTYTYFYYPAIDHESHDYGPDSSEAQAALLTLDAEITRLAGDLGGRARIVISADHGQFRVEDAAIRFIEQDDELLELLLCVPTGEGPEPAFHVRPGRAADFEVAFRRRFGDDYALLSAAEVEAMRLLGPKPLAAGARAALGDYLGLTADPVVLRYRPKAISMPGDHGGLSRDEMEVPLIII
jgi:hypothetical protein